MQEVPPFLWSDAGTFDSPKKYTVPGAGEVQPYTATATYTNASGQDVLPALRIKSAEGALLSLTFPVGDTIANGAAAEVTFVPPFGSAGSSGGGGIPSLPVAYIERNASDQTFTKNTAVTAVFDTYNTNNSTVFGGLDGTNQNLIVNMDGEYLCYARIEYNVVNDGQHALTIAAAVTGAPAIFPRVIRSDFPGQEQVLSKNAFYPLSLDTYTYVGAAGKTGLLGVILTSTGATINATGRARLQVVRLGDVAS